MSADARRRAADRIARLAWRHLDLVSFWRESAEAIASAVPYYWTPCWYTLDPASLLITSHFNEDIIEIPSEWLAQEYYEDDITTSPPWPVPRAASRRCMRRPAEIRLAARAGTPTWPWAGTRK